MCEPFIGQIVFFPWNWAPQGWLPCNGNLYAVQDYQALFSLLGNVYGGDARTTFGVPNLQGRVPVGIGQSKDAKTNWSLGTAHGSDSVAINTAQMPAHKHLMSFVLAPSKTGTPVVGCMLASISPSQAWAAPPPSNAVLDANSVQAAFGPGKTHENRQPYLTLNACIAYEGEYPNLHIH